MHANVQTLCCFHPPPPGTPSQVQVVKDNWVGGAVSTECSACASRQRLDSWTWQTLHGNVESPLACSKRCPGEPFLTWRARGDQLCMCAGAAPYPATAGTAGGAFNHESTMYEVTWPGTWTQVNYAGTKLNKGTTCTDLGDDGTSYKSVTECQESCDKMGGSCNTIMFKPYQSKSQTQQHIQGKCAKQHCERCTQGSADLSCRMSSSGSDEWIVHTRLTALVCQRRKNTYGMRGPSGTYACSCLPGTRGGFLQSLPLDTSPDGTPGLESRTQMHYHAAVGRAATCEPCGTIGTGLVLATGGLVNTCE